MRPASLLGCVWWIIPTTLAKLSETSRFTAVRDTLSADSLETETWAFRECGLIHGCCAQPRAIGDGLHEHARPATRESLRVRSNSTGFRDALRRHALNLFDKEETTSTDGGAVSR